MDKLKPLDELTATIADLKRSGKRIVLAQGAFDLLHIGHIRHLETAKRQGDVLVVAITADAFIKKGPGRPAFNQELRAEALASLASVDYVTIINEPSAVEGINKIKPDVYVKGGEYRDRKPESWHKFPKEKEAVESVGGRVHFTDEISFSSTSLINENFSLYPQQTQQFLQEFRKKYKAEDIIRDLNALKQLKVLVVGDTIIDEYYYCEGLGKTPKDNIIATKYLGEERFAGGVLAAANHIAGFCETVHLVTALGRKHSYDTFVKTHLKPNIQRYRIYQPGPTIVKRRFIDHEFLSKMFEIAYLEDKPAEQVHRKLDKTLARLIKYYHYDLVLVTDFGHGLINTDTAHLLANESRFLAVNAQANSANSGFNFITKYPRADYICLDEPELRLGCRDKYRSLERLMGEISQDLSCRKIALTRGHLGSLTFDREFLDSPGQFFNIPVFSTKVVDRTGAGDAYLSITAPCAAMNWPMELVGFLGNAVGALKVQIVGNKESVEPVPLFRFITALLK